MSLDNTPKIDWTTSDGLKNTDLNDIGKNLNSLEDSKYQETDDLDTTNADIDNITSGDINNSGFITSNYKSSDGSTGINTTFLIQEGGNDYTITVKDGLIVSKVIIP